MSPCAEGPPLRPLRRTAWRACARAVAALAAALLLACPCAQAESETVRAEYRIKAAFLFKFLAFVDWPVAAFERPDAPFVIGVLGARTVSDELGQVVPGQRVGAHPVQVRVLAPGDSAAGLQALFVARPETGLLASISTAADGQPLLVVTEASTGLPPGSTINFVVQDDKVRFDVSLPVADKAGLKISARLLAVARSVLPTPP